MVSGQAGMARASRAKIAAAAAGAGLRPKAFCALCEIVEFSPISQKGSMWPFPLASSSYFYTIQHK
jgi:hypothetical protein